MGIGEGDGNLYLEIESALASPKVDGRIRAEFAKHKDEHDFSASDYLVAMLARVSDRNISIEGLRILAGTISSLSVQAPFVIFPELVNDKRILSLQASPPPGLSQ